MGRNGALSSVRPAQHVRKGRYFCTPDAIFGARILFGDHLHAWRVVWSIAACNLRVHESELGADSVAGRQCTGDRVLILRLLSDRSFRRLLGAPPISHEVILASAPLPSLRAGAEFYYVLPRSPR